MKTNEKVNQAVKVEVQRATAHEPKKAKPVKTKETKGLRGLKKLVFDRFAIEYAKTNSFGSLPGIDVMTNEVKAAYPDSRWLARPKVHYSYYKSKFISEHKAA